MGRKLLIKLECIPDRLCRFAGYFQGLLNQRLIAAEYKDFIVCFQLKTNNKVCFSTIKSVAKSSPKFLI